jgi:chaperonin GroEL (HSP60 family)
MPGTILLQYVLNLVSIERKISSFGFKFKVDCSVAALLEKHKKGYKTFGVGAERGNLIDAQKAKIYDLLATKKNMFGLSTHCAITILRGTSFQIL